MKRRLGLASVIIVTILVIMAMPATALQTKTVVVSQNTTDTDFNNAQFTDNFSVENSGRAGQLNLSLLGGGVEPAEATTTTWIPMNESSGDTANDYVEPANDASLGDEATWVSNTNFVGDNYIDLDGTDDYLGLASPELTEEADWSVGITVQDGSALTNGEVIWAWGNGADGFNVQTQSGNITVHTFVGGDIQTGEQTPFPTTTGPVRLLVTWDAAANTAELYINGSEVTETFKDASMDTADNLTIGVRTNTESSGAPGFLNNGVDNFVIHNGTKLTLSDAETDFNRQPWSPETATGTAAERAEYHSQNRSVEKPENGLVNMTLDGTEAIVTWRECDASGTCTNIHTPQSFTSSGNHSIDISSAVESTIFVNVTIRNLTSSSSNVGIIHDDTVTFNATQPRLDNSTASPSGGTVLETADPTLQIHLNDSDYPLAQGDTVTVDWFVNGSQVNTTTHTTNETIQSPVTGLADGDHTWWVNITDSYGISNSSDDFDFTTTHGEPLVDNASATPTGDINTDRPTLEIQVNDSDFAPGGDDDTLTVTFYVDNSSIGTDTLNSNGTASITTSNLAGGDHVWNISVTDNVGNLNRSQWFDISVPGNVTVREETEPHSIITDPTGVEVRVFGSDETLANQTVTDGNISMAGLPLDETYVFSVNATGYHQREIIIKDVLSQDNIYLLNTSEESVQTTFDVEDNTGDFDPGETSLFIEKGINGSLVSTADDSFDFKVIAGDRLGADQEHTIQLAEEDRYRLVVENEEGDRRVLGEYTARLSQTVTLTIEDIDIDIVNQSAGLQIGFEVDDENNDVEFLYNDSEGNTTDLEVVIFERGNASNEIHNQTYAGPFGVLLIEEPIPETQTNRSWVVEYSGKRDGSSIDGRYITGDRGGIDFPLDEWIPQFAAVFAIIIAPSLLGGERAVTGAMLSVAIAGVAWWLEVLPPEINILSIMLAGAIAVGFKMRERGQGDIA